MAAAATAGLALRPLGSAAVRAAPAERVFRAGAASRIITPALDVPFNAPIMQIGPSRLVHDDLFARALVLDDGKTRVAIVICDVAVISQEVFDRAKRLVPQEAGLPVAHMLMAATHTHMAPRCAFGPSPSEAYDRYLEFLAGQIAAAVREAVENLTPARIGWGVALKPELARNRRWVLEPGAAARNPFGGTDRAQMSSRQPAGAKPAGPIDPEISFVSLQTVDGRPLALLANYGIHYVGFKAGEISADYFGYFSTRIGQLLGADAGKPPFVGILSNGTSGDVCAVRPAGDCYEAMQAVGFAVAEEVFRAVRQIEYRTWVPLGAPSADLELGVRRPAAQRLEWARQLLAKAEGKKQLARPEIYARETILLDKYPPHVKLPLQALRIGALGIAAIPCEVFA